MFQMKCALARALAMSAAAVLVLAGLAQAASAHPHVWINVRTLLMVEGGALVGLHHIWLLDEAWTTSQLEEHDKDKNGRLSQEELATVAKESRGTLDTFKSFTTVRHGTSRVRPLAPREVRIDYFGELLGMSFVVPLPKPIPLAGSDLLLEVYDATYFSGYQFAGPDAVTFAGEQPSGCTIKADASPSAQQQASFRLIKSQLGSDFLADTIKLQAVAVTCARKVDGKPEAKAEAVGFMPVR